jgi:hypothetical protein
LAAHLRDTARHADQNLTRENVMKQAAGLKDLERPLRNGDWQPVNARAGATCLLPRRSGALAY